MLGSPREARLFRIEEQRASAAGATTRRQASRGEKQPMIRARRAIFALAALMAAVPAAAQTVTVYGRLFPEVVCR